MLAAALAGSVLYLVAATAGSSTARGALEALGRQGDLTLGLLRCQLGDFGGGALPASVSLVIGQSPVLLSGQEAVLELRRSEERDDSPPAAGEAGVEPEPQEPTAPIPEEPAQPATPLVFADNGVAARTLVPSSPDG